MRPCLSKSLQNWTSSYRALMIVQKPTTKNKITFLVVLVLVWMRSWDAVIIFLLPLFKICFAITRLIKILSYEHFYSKCKTEYRHKTIQPQVINEWWVLYYFCFRISGISSSCRRRIIMSSLWPCLVRWCREDSHQFHYTSVLLSTGIDLIFLPVLAVFQI